MTRRPIALVVFFAALLRPVAAGAQDPGGLGPYKVGFTSFLAIDAGRFTDTPFNGRPIGVSVFYPVDAQEVDVDAPRAQFVRNPFNAPGVTLSSRDYDQYGLDPVYGSLTAAPGPFPIVLFSPGLGIPWIDYVYFAARTASHGFVVAVLAHYSDRTPYPGEPLIHRAELVMARPLDMSFALTELLARNTASGDILYGSMRPDGVAAAGHSIGGYTSLVLTGGDDSVCDAFVQDPRLPGIPPPAATCSAVNADPRFSAIVTLDGSNQFLHYYELTRVVVPAIGIGEDWDGCAASMGDPAYGSWQARQHAALSGHPSYRVDIVGSRHRASFSNECEQALVERDRGLITQAASDLRRQQSLCDDPTLIRPAEAHALVTKYAIAFLKTQLSRDTGFQHVLTPGWAVSAEHDVRFFETEKRDPNVVSVDSSSFLWPEDFWYFVTQPGGRQQRAPRDAGWINVKSPEEK